MSARPSLALVRAVQLLAERGEMYEDELIARIWPTIEPGPAFRQRERDMIRLRARRVNGGSDAGSSRPVPQQQAIEIGARRMCKHLVNGWVRTGIIERDVLDGRQSIRLLRIPSSIKARRKRKAA